MRRIEDILFKRQLEIRNKFWGTSERELVVVGGFGSGKTSLGAVITLEALRWGLVCLMAREYETEIINTMFNYLFKFAEDEEREYMIRNWNKNENRIVHPSGGILFYRSLSEINEGYTKLRGYEFNVAVIDEAWKITEQAYDEVLLRMRAKPIQKVLLLSNNDKITPGHWIYKRFAGKEERIYTWDNPFLDKKYIEEYKKKLSQEEFEMWAGKGWGQELKSTYPLSENNIVEMNKITLESKVIKWRHDRTFYAGIDWGIENFAFVLGAYDIDEEVLYLIDCWEFHRETIDDIVNTLKTDLQKKWKINFEKELYCVGDIEGKRKDWTGRTAYELFLKHKFRVEILDHIPLWDSIQLEQLLLKNKKIKILKQTDEINMSTDRIMNAYNSAYKIENNRVIKVNELQHIKDATRYLVWYVFKKRGKKGTSVYFLYMGGMGGRNENFRKT
jgi:hypothetical protein